jgi:peroxiredoxin
MKTLIAFLIFTISGGLYAQTESIITGKLLGHDGRPIQQTDIHKYISGQKSTANAHAAKDGSFTLTLKDSGLVTIKFAGVFHLSEDIPFLIEKPRTVHVNVQLGTYRYNKEPKDLRIMGAFNNWLMSDATPMKKHADGTFSADFETKDDKFAYEVIGAEVGGRSTNGTQSEAYEYDGDGDYRSIITPINGKVQIVYDISKVLSSPVRPSVTFEDASSRGAKYTMIKWEMVLRSRESSEAFQAFIAAGNDSKDFKSEKDLSAELPRIAAQLEAETDPFIRQILLISYLGASGGKGSPDIARMYLKVCPQLLNTYPRAQSWDLVPPYLTAGQILGFSDEFKKAVVDLLDGTSDMTFKGNLLNNMLFRVKQRNDDSLMQVYYNLAIQKISNASWERMLKDNFGPKTTLAAGKALPAFSVKSLDDPEVVYSNESFKGKVYLLHFWASWNSSSVKEMENIHKTYEKFKSRNFQILSLSLDANPQQVTKFRSGKWKMPWLHAFVTTDKKILGAFSTLASTLKPVLVDATGKIVALQNELQGDQLEKTLSRFLKVVN